MHISLIIVEGWKLFCGEIFGVVCPCKKLVDRRPWYGKEDEDVY